MAILLAVVLSGCQQTFLFIAPHLCQSIPYLIRARLEIGLDVFGFFFQQNLLSGSFFCGRQILLANIDLDLPAFAPCSSIASKRCAGAVDKMSPG